MATVPAVFYEFGPFRLDPARRRLLKDGEPVSLRPKAFDLLLTLVQRDGHEVDKDELMRLVWPDAIVEENNLTHTISKLRKVLGERLEDHRYIVTVPGRGYRFVAPVIPVGVMKPTDTIPFETAAGAPSPTTRLIVLPFRLLRADPTVEFLTFSLPDAVTVSLSGLESIVVRSSATAAQFSGDSIDLQLIADKADVDVVLTGTLLRAGDELRVNTQLVEAPAGTVLWSQACQAALGDIFQVQDDLVRRIVESLAPRLTARDERLLKHVLATRTLDPEVYAAYLKGRYHWNRRTPEGLRRAIACFEDAISRDSSYGLAYAGLADCYVLGGTGSLSRRDTMAHAKSAALKALALDDELAEAHSSLASLAFRWDWDWAAAEREFKRAIQLNPGVATIRHGYALFLTAMRRFPEALWHMKRAADIDPLSLVASVGLGRVLDFARRPREAIDQYHKALEIDSGFAEAHFDLAMAYDHARELDDALAAARHALALVPDSDVYAAYVAYLSARLGNRQQAEVLLDQFEDRAETKYVSPFLRASLMSALGRTDELFVWLRRACEERAIEVIYLNVDPDLDDLRPDPRFQDLLRYVGFPR